MTEDVDYIIDIDDYSEEEELMLAIILSYERDEFFFVRKGVSSGLSFRHCSPPTVGTLPSGQKS